MDRCNIRGALVLAGLHVLASETCRVCAPIRYRWHYDPQTLVEQNNERRRFDMEDLASLNDIALSSVFH